MKSLIVYDSVFGNTEQIALSIGNSLGSKENVAILQVSAIKPEQLVGLDLLIVGSPTRAFRPTKAISSFLNKIPSNSLKGIKVAAFDTRMSADDVKPRIVSLFMKLFGYAAKPIANKLKKKGGDLLVPLEGFFVKDSEGPLKDNELERAANWAKLFIETQ
jgi:flavodoxin